MKTVTPKENIKIIIIKPHKSLKFLFSKYFLIYKRYINGRPHFGINTKTTLNTVSRNFIEIIDTKVTNFSLKTAAIIVPFGLMTTSLQKMELAREDLHP